MERRWVMLVAGGLVGIALGLAILEGIPQKRQEIGTNVQDSGRDHDRDLLQVPESGTTESRSLDSVIGIAVGSEAPDFTLFDLEGNAIRLGDFRGQVVMVNFWATWCGPCKVEMPAFQTYYEQLLEEGFMVIAVNFDEPEQDVRDFQEELSLTFPLLLDPGGEVQRLYQIRGYPSSVFISRDGTIEYLHVGVITEGQLDFYLSALGIQS
jgi:peroxiredoxin